MAAKIPLPGSEPSRIPIPIKGESIPLHDHEYGEVGPIKGFRNNLRLPWQSWNEFMAGSPRGALEENLIGNLVKVVTGNTEENRLRRKYGDAYVDRLLEADEARKQSFSMSALKEAYNADPGAFAAEFVNAAIADPELLVTPIGWKGAAAKTAASLKTASAAQRTIIANTAGAGGAAATGAAIAVPISIADQIDNTGSVDWGQVGEETMLVAGLSVLMGGIGARKFNAENATEIAESTVGAAQTQAVGRTPIGQAVSEAVSSLKESPMGRLARQFIDKTGGKSITFLDEAAKRSPTLRKIRNAIEYEEFSKDPIAPSHYERVYMKTGEYITRLQEIMDGTRTRFLGRIRKADNDAIVAGLRGGKKTKVSRELRKLLDDVRNYSIRAGLDVGEVKNYFPRIYNVRALRKNEDQFIEALTKHGVDSADAHMIHKRIVDNEGTIESPSRLDRIDIHGRPVAKASNLERSRKLDQVPDEVLAPFLENDAYGVLRKYITGAVKRAEFANTFGPSGGKLNSDLAKAIAELNSLGYKMRRSELDRIYDIADAIQGTYNPFNEVVLSKASKLMGTYQLLRTLPLATLSSITEPMIILSRARVGSTLKAIPKLVEHTVKSWVRIMNKKYPKPEVTRAVERVGIALDDAIGEVLTQTFGGETNRVTTAFFKANMLSQWTRMNRILGFHTGRHMIVDNLTDISRGKKFRFQQMHDELSELGIPVKEGIEWLNRGMPDDEFAKRIDAGALRFTNEVVMNPRVTNRPLWHSNPSLHLVAQLKGFATVFGNTVMKRWFKKIIDDPLYQGPKIGAVGASMVMIAMLVNDLRDEVKGVERDETDYERVMRGIDRTGMTGIGQMAIDSMYAHRFGSSGLAQILGPFASQLNEMAEATGEAIDGDGKKLRREVGMAIPIVNQQKEWREEVEEALE